MLNLRRSILTQELLVRRQSGHRANYVARQIGQSLTKFPAFEKPGHLMVVLWFHALTEHHLNPGSLPKQLFGSLVCYGAPGPQDDLSAERPTRKYNSRISTARPPLPPRGIAQAEHRVAQRRHRRVHEGRCRVPPVIDHHVEVVERFDLMPPKRRGRSSRRRDGVHRLAPTSRLRGTLDNLARLSSGRLVTTLIVAPMPPDGIAALPVL